MSGHIFVVSAPSGAGKTSLLKSIIQDSNQLRVCVSHTTRAPREGEKDGRDYHFVDDQTFQTMLANDAFVEYAKVFDYYYGTSKQAINALLEQGYHVILEIDWQGARQARDIYQDQCTSIFIKPPSLEALRQRLYQRDLDTAQVIDRRMQEAQEAINYCDEYDHVIVNACFNQAKQQLEQLMTAPAQPINCETMKHSC